MLTVVCDSADRDNTTDPATSTSSLIDEIVREGARRMLAEEFPGLRGRQALVAAVIPFGDRRRHLIDAQTGKLGGGQGPSARAADHHEVLELEFTQCPARRLGFFTSGVGQLQLGAAGVLARLRLLGLPVSEQHQPVVLHAHADRLCQTFASRPAARGKGARMSL